jgi:hypothetical protein
MMGIVLGMLILIDGVFCLFMLTYQRGYASGCWYQNTVETQRLRDDVMCKIKWNLPMLISKINSQSV